MCRIFYFSAEEARRSISHVFEDEEVELLFWIGKVLLSYIPVLTLILKIKEFSLRIYCKLYLLRQTYICLKHFMPFFKVC